MGIVCEMFAYVQNVWLVDSLSQRGIECWRFTPRSCKYRANCKVRLAKSLWVQTPSLSNWTKSTHWLPVLHCVVFCFVTWQWLLPCTVLDRVLCSFLLLLCSENPVTTKFCSACAQDMAVVDMGKCGKFLTDDEKYALLRDHFKPGPHFKFPVRAYAGRSRTVQLAWFEKYHGLVYLPLNNGAFCLNCSFVIKALDSFCLNH